MRRVGEAFLSPLVILLLLLWITPPAAVAGATFMLGCELFGGAEHAGARVGAGVLMLVVSYPVLAWWIEKTEKVLDR